MFFKSRLFQFFLILFLSLISFSASAELIWKQPNNPANSVSLEKIKEEKAEGLVLNHPYTFDPKKLTDMFLSLRYNKSVLFLKDVEDQSIFFDVKLLENKFIPHIVEAFQKATPNQVVSISIVQKDPYFIVRNDRLNIIRAYVAQDGLHLKFVKTDAKLMGDYQAHTTGTKMIDRAQGMKVTFEPQPGQMLSFDDPREIILDLNYDFASLVDKKAEEDKAREEESKKRKRSDKTPESRSTPAPSTSVTTPGKTTTPATPASSTPSPSSPQPKPAGAGKSSAERLKELKVLKDEGLITPKEYEEKKSEILKGL